MTSQRPTPSRREFPRVPYAGPAELLVRVPRGWHQVPATLRSISPGGVGLAVHGALLPPPARGATVAVRLSIGTQDVELPAQVAWSRAQTDRRQLEIGLQLRLELAKAMNRQAFATWIVSMLQGAASPRPTPPRPTRASSQPF